MDEGLSDAQRETLRQNLRTLQDEITRDLTLSEGGDRPVDLDEPIGRLSRMEAIQQQKMTAATRYRQKQRLVRVRGALVRLSEDPEAFGFCLRCDDPIAWKRMQARPESTLCITCQSDVEAR